MQQLLIKLLLLLCISSAALSANFALALPLSNALHSIYGALVHLERADLAKAQLEKRYLEKIQLAKSRTLEDINHASDYYFLNNTLKRVNHHHTLQVIQLLQQKVARKYLVQQQVVLIVSGLENPLVNCLANSSKDISASFPLLTQNHSILTSNA